MNNLPSSVIAPAWELPAATALTRTPANAAITILAQSPYACVHTFQTPLDQPWEILHAIYVHRQTAAQAQLTLIVFAPAIDFSLISEYQIKRMTSTSLRDTNFLLFKIHLKNRISCKSDHALRQLLNARRRRRRRRRLEKHRKTNTQDNHPNSEAQALHAKLYLAPQLPSLALSLQDGNGGDSTLSAAAVEVPAHGWSYQRLLVPGLRPRRGSDRDSSFGVGRDGIAGDVGELFRHAYYSEKVVLAPDYSWSFSSRHLQY